MDAKLLRQGDGGSFSYVSVVNESLDARLRIPLLIKIGIKKLNFVQKF